MAVVKAAYRGQGVQVVKRRNGERTRTRKGLPTREKNVHWLGCRNEVLKKTADRKTNNRKRSRGMLRSYPRS